MESMIFTKNQYLKIAIEQIILCYGKVRPVCIIDTASFSSLSNIRYTLKSNNLGLEYVIFFIGGNDILSCVMERLMLIPCKSPLDSVKMTIHNGRGCNITKALEYLDACITLKKLTTCEKLAAITFLRLDTFHMTASLLNANKKTLYARLRNIAIKFNLRSISHLKFFLEMEFSDVMPSSVIVLQHNNDAVDNYRVSLWPDTTGEKLTEKNKHDSTVDKFEQVNVAVDHRLAELSM
ncbi:hypothetical protein ZL58_20805 [Salmonella enterica subsp. enterica serovar Typhimurium]|nr:hypothetical protein [Salmonella enterica subsp. enterica serovar Typhimurium]EHG4385636.1 hypothetical protein [Salmonella enterica subsp. enterica serovar Typhimurium]